jgi:hypothetical protein
MIHKLRQQHPEYNDMPDEQLLSGIHQKHYSDMPPEEFHSRIFPGKRPNHDDLATAAVTGSDSLDLQDIDPTVKPVVKMQAKELAKLMPRIQGKIAVIWNDTVYVVAPDAIDPVQAIQGIMSGNDSEILGYPEDGPCDCCVTKQGDIVTDLPTMKRHAETKNIIWAARGQSIPLIDKARKVSAAITNKPTRKTEEQQ